MALEALLAVASVLETPSNAPPEALALAGCLVRHEPIASCGLSCVPSLAAAAVAVLEAHAEGADAARARTRASTTAPQVGEASAVTVADARRRREEACRLLNALVDVGGLGAEAGGAAGVGQAQSNGVSDALDSLAFEVAQALERSCYDPCRAVRSAATAARNVLDYGVGGPPLTTPVPAMALLGGASVSALRPMDAYTLASSRFHTPGRATPPEGTNPRASELATPGYSGRDAFGFGGARQHARAAHADATEGRRGGSTSGSKSSRLRVPTPRSAVAMRTPPSVDEAQLRSPERAASGARAGTSRGRPALRAPAARSRTPSPAAARDGACSPGPKAPLPSPTEAARAVVRLAERRGEESPGRGGAENSAPEGRSPGARGGGAPASPVSPASTILSTTPSRSRGSPLYPRGVAAAAASSPAKSPAARIAGSARRGLALIEEASADEGGPAAADVPEPRPGMMRRALDAITRRTKDDSPPAGAATVAGADALAGRKSAAPGAPVLGLPTPLVRSMVAGGAESVRIDVTPPGARTRAESSTPLSLGDARLEGLFSAAKAALESPESPAAAVELSVLLARAAELREDDQQQSDEGGWLKANGAEAVNGGASDRKRERGSLLAAVLGELEDPRPGNRRQSQGNMDGARGAGDHRSDARESTLEHPRALVQHVKSAPATPERHLFVARPAPHFGSPFIEPRQTAKVRARVHWCEGARACGHPVAFLFAPLSSCPRASI